MHDKITIGQTEQYQMNGALIGLLIGMGSGLFIFGGIGGIIMGGVFGLFGGTLLGTTTTKLNHTTGRLLVGVILAVLAFFVVRNIAQDVSSIFSSSATDSINAPYDGSYYLEEETLR